jgi:hypothetical protein
MTNLKLNLNLDIVILNSGHIYLIIKEIIPEFKHYFLLDIFHNPLNEIKYLSNPNYKFEDVKNSNLIRAKLIYNFFCFIDNNNFSYSRETLFLTINYFDKFCSLKCIHSNIRNLVLIAAFNLAIKYEEDIIGFNELFANNDYDWKDILKVEDDMLHILNHELSHPTYYWFCYRLLSNINASPIEYEMTILFLKIFLMDQSILKYCPSTISKVVITAARNQLKLLPAWTKKLEKLYRHSKLNSFSNHLECKKDFYVVFKKVQSKPYFKFKEIIEKKWFTQINNVLCSLDSQYTH